MQRLSKFKDKAFLACLKADWLNTCANWLNGMKIIGGEVLHTPDGIIINPFMSYGAGGGDTTPEAFGIKSIVDDTVTIYAGKIWIGKDEKAAGDTALTLNTDSFVGWEYAFGGGLTIKNFGSTFAQDDGYIRKPLFYFTYTAPVSPATVGSIAVSTGLHRCDVFPANWGSY